MSDTLSPSAIDGTPRQRNQHPPGLCDDEAGRPAPAAGRTKLGAPRNAPENANTTKAPTSLVLVEMAPSWAGQTYDGGCRLAAGALPTGARSALEQAAAQSELPSAPPRPNRALTGI